MRIRFVHYVNQFFAGRGGEEQADCGIEVREGPVGPGRLVARQLGEAGTIVATVSCGDNAFHVDPDRSAAEVADLVARYRPDVVVAGPAFDAGRYGLACGYVCRAVRERLAVAALAAMAPDNPAVEQFRRDVYIVPTARSAVGMAEAVPRIVRLAVRLAAGEAVGAPEVEGYVPMGRRRNVLADRRAAARVVDLLLRKVRGEPYESEIPIPAFDRVPPAPPVERIDTATIALVSEGGIVPRGNPDRIESTRATRWGSYDVSRLSRLPAGDFVCIHAGWANELANEDPNRVIPLDAARELTGDGRIGRLHERYYVTVGSSCTVENAQRFGRDIAARLHAAGVQAAILTAT